MRRVRWFAAALGTGVAIMLVSGGVAAAAPCISGTANNVPNAPNVGGGSVAGQQVTVGTQQLCEWRDVKYGRRNHKLNGTLDRGALKAVAYRRLTLPDGSPDTSTAPRRVLIALHGGGFTTGRGNYAHMERWAKWAALQGWVGITAEYNLAPQGAWNDPFRPGNAVGYAKYAAEATRNVQTLVRYLREYGPAAGIDVSKITVMGESAGGVTAIAVGTRPNEAGNPAYVPEAGDAGVPAGAAGDLKIRGFENHSSKIHKVVGVVASECFPARSSTNPNGWIDGQVGFWFPIFGVKVRYAMRFGECPVPAPLSR
ncbi:alpha/beta hydrolase [Svornostia abyssi]|uniref:Alpha/beta hydrolase n=1 Tax=Svornostia abyssi TaxID=2898438 RepID=A0ABY5PI39_9ACTN|nr:alpha/beta hydrolase [Parviterribacteraceae bacterium J379]